MLLKTIQNFNINKAHGNDWISIQILQICTNLPSRLLKLIFNDCLANGIFQFDWKKGNIVTVHKKNDKQCLKNYRAISLFTICCKTLLRLIIMERFGFFMENYLISRHQSGFKLRDSCINQLLSITHEIYQPFDKGFNVFSVFIDISKTLDKVWHDGIIFTLKQNGISGNFLYLLSNILRTKKQIVVLND